MILAAGRRDAFVRALVFAAGIGEYPAAVGLATRIWPRRTRTDERPAGAGAAPEMDPKQMTRENNRRRIVGDLGLFRSAA
jgi:hypothetical protein